MHTRTPASSTCLVPVTRLALPGSCWRCRRPVLPLVGVFVPSRRGRALRRVRRRGVGPIKIRRSRRRPDGYLANGCIHCDAILGDFPLREDLVAFRADGGQLDELALATLVLPTRASRPALRRGPSD
jgi:hypothetical protein